jgi:hypothetical protein
MATLSEGERGEGVELSMEDGRGLHGPAVRLSRCFRRLSGGSFAGPRNVTLVSKTTEDRNLKPQINTRGLAGSHDTSESIQSETYTCVYSFSLRRYRMNASRLSRVSSARAFSSRPPGRFRSTAFAARFTPSTASERRVRKPPVRKLVSYGRPSSA